MLNHKNKAAIVEQIKPIIKKYGLTEFTVFTPRYIEHKDPFYIALSTYNFSNPFDYLTMAEELRTIRLANIKITDTAFIQHNNTFEIQRRAELIEDITKGETYSD